MRSRTFGERRRLYLLARLVVKYHYRKHLTLDMVAKALAISPRQLQRVYAQFGGGTFSDDLRARRMAAAAELLSQRAVPVRKVAQQVGYRQASHFARTFRCRYGVSPTDFRTLQAKKLGPTQRGSAGRDA